MTVFALATTASAGGVPDSEIMSYTGALLDSSGVPAKQPMQIQVGLYASKKVGAPAKCLSKVGTTKAGTGRFRLDLGMACAKAVHDHPNLWAEVVVGSTTKVPLPRVKLGAVPYALEAASAVSAGGQLKAKLDSVGAAAGKVDGLESKLAKLEKRVLALESAQPDAMKVDLFMSDKSTPHPATITTKGSTVVLIAAGKLSKASDLSLAIDGAEVAWVQEPLGAVFAMTGVAKKMKPGKHSIVLTAKDPVVCIHKGNKGPCMLTVVNLP